MLCGKNLKKRNNSGMKLKMEKVNEKILKKNKLLIIIIFFLN